MKLRVIKNAYDVVTSEDKIIMNFKRLADTFEYKEFIKFVDILNQRWVTEKHREDFNSYIKFIEKKIPKGLKLIKMYRDFTVKMRYGKTAVAVVNVTPRELHTNLYFDLK